MITLPKIYHFAVYLLCFALVSCSSGMRESESISAKMSRYDAKRDQDTSVPALTISTQYFNGGGASAKGRGPASKSGGESFDFGSPADSGPDRTSYSNRSLYYVTLLSQYQNLRGFSSGQTSDINSCPSFHSMHLEYLENGGLTKGDRRQWKKQLALKRLRDEKYLAQYPELFLPVVNEGTSPKVVDLLNGNSMGGQSFVVQTIQKALDIHIQKTYQELATLCENGVSTNYYNFENLITHITRADNFGPTSKNLQVLFKTTIFVNMAMIDSMVVGESMVRPAKRGRSIASQQGAFSSGRSYERQVIKRLRVPWVGEYLKQLP
ncbi:MAG: hypothetical protein HN353_12215 [Bdellovibrionales bacterium]|jgi:hypothetical protein|nr:hypothetical protein [Bdellovibrionales bacterium]MBT3526139.1 hypothetical protein [Bdellovibrionales bacterium]MBT7768204.1 hypothetical protein [Bdellovibrionales bacterium]